MIRVNSDVCFECLELLAVVLSALKRQGNIVFAKFSFSIPNAGVPAELSAKRFA